MAQNEPRLIGLFEGIERMQTIRLVGDLCVYTENLFFDQSLLNILKRTGVDVLHQFGMIRYQIRTMGLETFPEPPALAIALVFVCDPKGVGFRNSGHGSVAQYGMGREPLDTELTQHIAGDGVHVGLVAAAVQLQKSRLPGLVSDRE